MLIRTILEYIASKAKASGATKNPVVKCCFCVARCALKIVECCVRYLNRNA